MNKSIKICNRVKAKSGENIVMQQRRAVASSSNNADGQNGDLVLFYFFIQCPDVALADYYHPWISDNKHCIVFLNQIIITFRNDITN